MPKKTIKLTSEELHKIIEDATKKILNEMDAKTYSRIYNTSRRAMQDIQNGIDKRSINGKKFVDNDDIITRANDLEAKVQSHWLRNYIGKTFKFFGRSQMGLPSHVLFTFNKITKLEPNKTILIGDVIFNKTKISGDGIILDFVKETVKYHERGSRYTYNLEIDNRYKPLWDNFTNELKQAINARI